MPEPRSGKIPFPLRAVPPRFLDGAEYSIAQRLRRHENRSLAHVNADMRLILVLSPRNAPGDSVSYFALQASRGRARSGRLSRRRGSPRPDHRQRIIPGAVGARCSCDCRPGGVMLTRGSPGTLSGNVPGLHTGGDGGTLQIADFGRFSDWHDRADFFTFRWNCAEFLLHTIAHRVPPNARISLGDVARR